MGNTGDTENKALSEAHEAGRLRAYLDGELPEGETSELETHLAFCEECRAMRDEMRSGAVEMRSLLAIPARIPDPHLALYGLRKTLAAQAASSHPTQERLAEKLPVPRGRAAIGRQAHSNARWQQLVLSGVGVALAAAFALGLAVFWSGLPARVPQEPQVIGNPAGPDATVSASSQTQTPSAPLGALIGQQAPHFSAVDVRTNGAVSLAQYRGSVVVLTVWGTWCSTCVDMLDDLQQLSTGVQIVSVSAGPGDTPEKVRQFLSDKDYNWPFLHMDSMESAQYGSGSLPTTYVLDTQGRLSAILVGRVGTAQLQQEIDTARQSQPQGPEPDGDPLAGFVPPGKARHLAYTRFGVATEGGRPSNALATTGQTYTYTQHIWLANGKDHLIGHVDSSGYPLFDKLKLWVEDDHVYWHRADTNRVYRNEYNSSLLNSHLPNQDNFLRQGTVFYDAVTLGTGTVNGRSVTLMEYLGSSDTAPEPPDPSVPDFFTTKIKVAIDSQTRQVVQYRAVKEYMRGPRSGTSEISMGYDLVLDELKDQAEFSADFFKFKMPEGAILSTGNPFAAPSTTTTASASATAVAYTNDPAAGFVPPGKVRHIVVTTRNEATVASHRPTTMSRDIWFANGDSHSPLLMRYIATQEDWSFVPADFGFYTQGAAPREMWLTGDALYLHVLGEADVRPVANVVLKYAYDPGYLEVYGPAPGAVSKLLEMHPEARVLGNTWLDNHPVVKIEKSATLGQPARTPSTEADSAPASAMTTTHWIDLDTGQHRRVEIVTRAPAAPGGEVQVFTSTTFIERDELLDAGQAQPDFFEFKMPQGASLIERDRKLELLGVEEWSNSWFEHVEVPGNFSVLMPHTPEFSQDSAGQVTLGAKMGSVTYGVKYVTAEVDLTAPENQERLNRAFAQAVPEGTVISELDITLGAYPGKEYTWRDDNGNYRIWRVYAAGQRLYTVFALAPNETTDPEIVRDFFASFKLLSP